MSRSVPNKWIKTKALLKHEGVAKSIPETRMFSSAALKAMLGKYGSVVAKPCIGGGGQGVIMIRSGSGYTVRYYGKTLRANHFTGLLRLFKRLRLRRAYILQRAIKLATIGGRPVDYRVKLVRAGGRWQLRAVVARIARRGYFVTNLCRGGDLWKSRDAIRQSLHINPGHKKRQLIGLSYASTRILVKKFPGISELGFDYGIDQSGKIWMFEVNTRPQ